MNNNCLIQTDKVQAGGINIQQINNHTKNVKTLIGNLAFNWNGKKK